MKMTICLVIFALTLLSYILNKIPMWLTSLISLSALYITGCLTAAEALAGFSNTNTILMAAMCVVAAGFSRTSMVNTLCNSILKVTHGSFHAAYIGYLVVAAILANFIPSPLATYLVISPLLTALCDNTGNSRSKYMFPLMVICVSCCCTLPFPTAIRQAGQYTGFLESYGFSGMEIRPVDFLIGTWPIMVIALIWAAFFAPKSMPATPTVPIEALARKASVKNTEKLSPIADRLGVIVFCATIVCLIFSSQLKLATWFVALVGSLLMVLFGVVDSKTALKDIPWDMLMLFVGALALGTALMNTGAGDAIGSALAFIVGGTHNNYVLGLVFFAIPFIVTQFMSNLTTATIFVPICLLTCSALGANPIGLVLLVNAGALTSFLTPMATPAVPVCMSDGGYDLKDLLKGGILITVVLCVVYVIFTMTVYPAF